MTKEKILQKLNAMGYTIKLVKKDNSIFVTLCSKIAVKNYTLPRSYSNEYTSYQIQLDVIYDLMEWAGMRIVEKLE